MDFYAILGVTREATVDDVKRAYRRLARRFHPDINPGDELAALRFKEIALAYETLIDPDSRRRYDLVGHRVEPPEMPGVGFEGFDFTASVHANSAIHVRRSVRRRVQARASAGGRRLRTRRRSASDDDAVLRKRPAGRRTRGRGDAARSLRHLQWDRRARWRGIAVRAVSGQRGAAIGAGAHGLFETVSDLRRQWRGAPAALRRVRGDRADGAD